MQPNFLGTKLFMMYTQPEEVSHQLKTIIASSAFQLKFNTLSAFFNNSLIRDCLLSLVGTLGSPTRIILTNSEQPTIGQVELHCYLQ